MLIDEGLLQTYY